MTISLPWRDRGFGAGPLISTSLAQVEMDRLQELAAGKRVLEIGSAYGYSTVGLALVAASVVTIDPHMTHGSHVALVDNLFKYGVQDRVDIRVGFSQYWLPMLAGGAGGELFDVAFIDGDHTTPGVLHDVMQTRALVSDGGVIACHDYDEATCPGVRVALDQLYPAGPAELVNTLYIIRGEA
jgi:predicted O-methyltransferase YrrM